MSCTDRLPNKILSVANTDLDILIAAFAALAIGGCETDPAAPISSTPPAVPALAPGMAMAEGRVLDPAGQAVAGAAVALLEAPVDGAARTALTDAGGRWQLVIPADTSVTLHATAAGFAPTRFGSFLVAAGTMASDLDLLMLPRAELERLNVEAGGRATEDGLAAIEVVSLGSCVATGGRVALDPERAGQVVYGAGKAVAPDPDADSIQLGARPAAWLLGVRPPGVYYRLRFENPGCTQKVGPIEHHGRIHQGGLSFSPGTLTQGLLFAE
jgi:hypothetical protein